MTVVDRPLQLLLQAQHLCFGGFQLLLEGARVKGGLGITEGTSLSLMGMGTFMLGGRRGQMSWVASRVWGALWGDVMSEVVSRDQQSQGLGHVSGKPHHPLDQILSSGLRDGAIYGEVPNPLT